MSNLAIYRHPKGPIPIIHLDESCPATRTNGVPCICPKESTDPWLDEPMTAAEQAACNEADDLLTPSEREAEQRAAGIPSHADIVPSLFAATKAADAEQRSDDAIGRQQSQRQQFIDVLDAAYQQALRGNLKFVIDFTTDGTEGDWLIDWAVGKGITEISHRYENGNGSSTNTVDVNGRRFARIVQLAAVSQ